MHVVDSALRWRHVPKQLHADHTTGHRAHPTGKVVFAKRFFYTGAETPMGVTVIEADRKYSFSSANALVADPAGAAEGLRAAVPPMAKAIVDMLAKTKT